jgi:hypothetical protein
VDNLDVEVSPELDRFTRRDLDLGPPEVDLEDYDVVLLLDIIEHLDSPERLLAALRQLPGATQPCYVISVPNVGFVPVRLRLMLGGFEYGREGILDLTHRRLFTQRSLRRLLTQYGFDARCLEGVPAPFPKAIGDHWFSRALVAANSVLIRFARGLFSYQIFVIADARPTVEELLRRTRDASETRRRELSG